MTPENGHFSKVPTSIEMLRAEIGRLLAQARIEKAMRGHFQCGPAPFGYIRDYAGKDEGIPLVPHSSESEVVRTIFREYLRLKSLSKVADRLNGESLLTRRGSPWTRASLAWVLGNPVYLGKVVYSSVKTKGRHPAIISPIVYNKVQKLRRENRKK